MNLSLSGITMYYNGRFQLQNSAALLSDVVRIWRLQTSDSNMLCVCNRPPNTDQVVWDHFQDSLAKFRPCQQSGNVNVLIVGNLIADPGLFF